jgi:hypothetical protein
VSGLQCTNWSPDNDGDGFGDERVIQRRCGAPSAGFVENDDDCCDQDAFARPGASFIDRARIGCGGFDFDCNDSIEASPPVGVCSDFGADNCPLSLSIDLRCGEPLVTAICRVTSGGCSLVETRNLVGDQTCR